MASLRHRIDDQFSAFGRLVFRHRLKTLLLVLLAVGALASQLPRLQFDTSTESFFRTDDPHLVSYNRFRDQFGRDEFIIAAVTPPNVFDRAFLERLRDFHQALEAEVPHLKEVTSLINVRDTRGEGDRLVVEDLLKEIPQTPQAMAAFRKHVLDSELYPNLFISKDGRMTTVLVETLAFSDAGAGDDLLAGFGDADLPGQAPAGGKVKARTPLTDEQNSAVVRAVERVVERFNGPDFPIHFTGSPVVTDFLKRAMQHSMARFILLALLAIGLFLGLLFRRVSGVVLPLLVVLLSLAATVGAMAAMGVALKLPQMILPSFLLAVGVGTVVHLLAVFYRYYEEGDSKEDALAHALGHSGLPIVMTSLTTAAGLLSFLTAQLASVGDLGLFASVGVVIALVLTLVLVPAMLALMPLRRRPRFAARGGSPLTDRFLTACADFATRRAGVVVALSAIIAIVAAAGLPSLRFSHNTLRWFPKDGQIRQSTDLIDKAMHGSISVEVMVDAGKENAFYDPSMERRLDELTAYAEQYTGADGKPFVGKTNSVADVLKEINRALHENRPDAYRIPDDRDLIAQELLLFENSGSDDLERMVDSRFSMARVSIKSPWDDASAYVDYVDDLEAKGRSLFGNDAKVTVTGLIRLFTASIVALMHSMVTSYTVAVTVITLMMIALIGRFRLGLLSMLPNLLPIMITLGFMGWVGIPLDAFTLLIGSIALGLAVDDTIHFFHNFQRYYDQGAGVEQAVHETMLSTGRAMLITTLVLATGFWLFMFADLNNLYYFGLLTGMTLVLALAADILMSPALISLFRRWLVRARPEAAEGRERAAS